MRSGAIWSGARRDEALEVFRAFGASDAAAFNARARPGPWARAHPTDGRVCSSEQVRVLNLHICVHRMNVV